MSQPSPLVDRRLAQQLSLAQFMIIPLVVLLACILFNPMIAKNAASGALIGWLGSVYFAWQAFRQSGASASRSVLGGFYRGMIGKFVIIVIGFSVVFAMLRPLSAGAVLIGFGSVQLMAWIYPLWINRNI